MVCFRVDLYLVAFVSLLYPGDAGSTPIRKAKRAAAPNALTSFETRQHADDYAMLESSNGMEKSSRKADDFERVHAVIDHTSLVKNYIQKNRHEMVQNRSTQTAMYVTTGLYSLKSQEGGMLYINMHSAEPFDGGSVHQWNYPQAFQLQDKGDGWAAIWSDTTLQWLNIDSSNVENAGGVFQWEYPQRFRLRRQGTDSHGNQIVTIYSEFSIFVNVDISQRSNGGQVYQWHHAQKFVLEPVDRAAYYTKQSRLLRSWYYPNWEVTNDAISPPNVRRSSRFNIQVRVAGKMRFHDSFVHETIPRNGNGNIYSPWEPPSSNTRDDKPGIDDGVHWKVVQDISMAWTEFEYASDVDVKISRKDGQSLGSASNVVIRPTSIRYSVTATDGHITIHVPRDARGRRFSVEFQNDLYHFHSNGNDFVEPHQGEHVGSEPRHALLIFASPFLPTSKIPVMDRTNTTTMTPGPINNNDWGNKRVLYFPKGVYWINQAQPNVQNAIGAIRLGQNKIRLHPNTVWVHFEAGAYIKGAIEFSTSEDMYSTGHGVLSGEHYVYEANPAACGWSGPFGRQPAEYGCYQGKKSDGTSLRLWENHECAGDSYVRVRSHRNEHLQDLGGVARLTKNEGDWERWSLQDASPGLVYIRSHRNVNLQDDHGQVTLTANALTWEEWRLRDAGDGKVFITSHRGMNLQDDQGSLMMSPNEGSWERWTVVRVCKPGQTWNVVGPTLNAPPFNSVDFHTHPAVKMSDYKQVGAFFVQTDGPQVYPGSEVHDTFYHCNDDGIKMYYSNVEINDIIIWKIYNAPVIQMGWTTYDIRNISISGIHVIHSRYRKRETYGPSAIIGASPYYDPTIRTADPKKTISADIRNIVCEGAQCPALLIITPLQNIDLKITDVTYIDGISNVYNIGQSWVNTSFPVSVRIEINNWTIRGQAVGMGPWTTDTFTGGVTKLNLSGVSSR